MLAKRWNQTGRVIIKSETTDEPISMMGEFAGICYEADITNHEKNFERGLNCIHSGHGRVMEYPQIYMEISGYSARVIREFERHTSGSPTYLQSSTRYNLKDDFKYITPPSIANDNAAASYYTKVMEEIQDGIGKLMRTNAKKEDIAMLLPLGMETKIIHRTNLRNLYDMAHQRLCSRAYWEYQDLFNDIIRALSLYSDEWDYLIKKEKLFVPKCKFLGHCPENKSCGKMPTKETYHD